MIHSLLGFLECGGIGPAKGGLSECHELKIIEILSWVIAVVSVFAAVPIVLRATKRRGQQAERKIEEEKGEHMNDGPSSGTRSKKGKWWKKGPLSG